MALTRINNNSLSSVTAAAIPKGAGEIVQVITAINNNSYSLGDSGDTWNNVLFNDVQLIAKTNNPKIQIDSVVHCGTKVGENNAYSVFRWEYKVGSGGTYAHFNPWNNADNGVECDFFFGGSSVGGDSLTSGQYRTIPLSCSRVGIISCSAGDTLYFRLMRNGATNDSMTLNRADNIASYSYYGGLLESTASIMEIAGA